jgi:hypothetical protein
VDAPSNVRTGADGVVRNITDHPVCSSFGTGPFLLVVADTPPLEEGNEASWTFHLVGKVRWTGGKSLPRDKPAWLRPAPKTNSSRRNEGDVDAGMAEAAKVIRATWKKYRLVRFGLRTQIGGRIRFSRSRRSTDPVLIDQPDAPPEAWANSHRYQQPQHWQCDLGRFRLHRNASTRLEATRR